MPQDKLPRADGYDDLPDPDDVGGAAFFSWRDLPPGDFVTLEILEIRWGDDIESTQESTQMEYLARDVDTGSERAYPIGSKRLASLIKVARPEVGDVIRIRVEQEGVGDTGRRYYLALEEEDGGFREVEAE